MSNWRGRTGPLLIAEIGGNHEGDPDYALKLAKLAIEAEVDFIKFQIYTGDTLVSQIESPQRNEHFKKFELDRNKHITLAELCKENEIGYMASVWDVEAIDWIDPYLNIYKIGSGDLTAYPVLAKIASKNKPIILSTGLAEQHEVAECINFLTNTNPIYKGKENLALLQCTSMYPIPESDANLNVMRGYKKAFGYPVGYSDHTEGMKALEIAVAMGAEILEFHFTDSREDKSFRDHKVSLTKDEVIELKQKIKRIYTLQGNSEKTTLDIERDHFISFRRAIYPKVDIAADTIITEEHLTCLRPNHGIDAREFKKLIGKRPKQDLKRHQKLVWDLFY
ncbi:N-acetylneuraminate synthase family protein [Fulvivirgaceae bacterium BMA10]|uniref:N-acetylneuraminate synthase family protein n=1 Tax=Splendidivirga corallicola TaxID=3051826 RepID=A0ABT8KGZ8_9BACT|nr:N-acetylneuraminate synthase family protein [Fulvivirgaceae bacterium BMA10]